MKAAELRELNAVELNKKLGELKEELFNLRFQHAINQLDNPGRIEAVKNAEDKKYVLMNVPTDRVEDVVAVLPGAKSPTVMPLATPGWSSVHTVIDEQRFWQIIRQLKELGAQGILVVPIEKMIL